jgi:hypothetical protein
MSLSCFGEKPLVPNEKMLTEALADSKTLWDSIKNAVASACGEMSEEWKYYSKKAGWSFIVKSGKRTILYMIPQDSFFKVNFVLGEKAVAAARTANLPDSIIALIDEATSYAEGRSIMFDVKSDVDVSVVYKLIEVKHSN